MMTVTTWITQSKTSDVNVIGVTKKSTGFIGITTSVISVNTRSTNSAQSFQKRCNTLSTFVLIVIIILFFTGWDTTRIAMYAEPVISKISFHIVALNVIFTLICIVLRDIWKPTSFITLATYTHWFALLKKFYVSAMRVGRNMKGSFINVLLVHSCYSTVIVHSYPKTCQSNKLQMIFFLILTHSPLHIP